LPCFQRSKGSFSFSSHIRTLTLSSTLLRHSHYSNSCHVIMPIRHQSGGIISEAATRPSVCLSVCPSHAITRLVLHILLVCYFLLIYVFFWLLCSVSLSLFFVYSFLLLYCSTANKVEYRPITQKAVRF